MLLRNHYTKIVNKYLFLQIVITTYVIFSKADRWKYLLNGCWCNYFDIVFLTNIRKIYIIAINSYTKYYVFFKKKTFLAQIGRLVVQIGYLERKKLKPKIINRYLVGLELFYLDYTLNIAELKIYSHFILSKIITNL